MPTPIFKDADFAAPDLTAGLGRVTDLTNLDDKPPGDPNGKSPKQLVKCLKSKPLMDYLKTKTGTGADGLYIFDMRQSASVDPPAVKIPGAVNDYPYTLSANNGATVFKQLLDYKKPDKTKPGVLWDFNNLPRTVVFYCQWGNERSPEMAIRYAAYLFGNSAGDQVQVCYLKGGITGYNNDTKIFYPKDTDRSKYLKPW